MKRRAGFTLLEILTVIGVAAALLAIGVPAMQAMRQNASLNGSVQEMASILRQAQGQATANQGGSTAAHTVQYLTPSSYQLTSGSIVTPFSLSDGVSFGTDFGTISFAPRVGTANTTTTITITGASQTKQIVVSNTGVVTIQ